jgi:hypothetical protein
VQGANGTFTINNSTIFGSWSVPAAHQPLYPPVCSSTWFYSYQWVGFDGWGSNDVLQAGTEADATCTSTLYSFWYEWFPYAQTRISSPTILPGDFAQIEVWYTTSSPYGHAMVSNLTAGTGAVVGFNPPSGTTYVGDSAEWVLERPTINGSLADLPNVDAAYTGNEAWAGSTIYYPGSSPANVTTYNINMVCPPWNPSSACPSTTTILYANVAGTYVVYFVPDAPAY